MMKLQSAMQFKPSTSSCTLQIVQGPKTTI